MTVRVWATIDGLRIKDWSNYTIANDMLSPADSFSMSLGPITSEIADACTPDAPVVVEFGGTKVLVGLIDSRDMSGDALGGSRISISGRDKAGRLVDESADLTTYRDHTLRTLAEEVVSPWFDTVVTSNKANRDAARGRKAVRVASFSEPVLKLGGKKNRPPRKVNPGEKKWDVLQWFLEESDALAWSSADGESFILGNPNYDQRPQYMFRAALPGSLRKGNVLKWSLADNVGEMSSSVRLVGSGRGSKSRYGKGVIRNTATVAGNSDIFGRAAREFLSGKGTGDFASDGTGGDFRLRKQLIVQDDRANTPERAKELADRELRLMEQGARMLEIVVEGHAQPLAAGAEPALYTFDTVCNVEIDLIGLRAQFLITAVEFRNSKQAGQTTKLTMVPVGTVLRV